MADAVKLLPELPPKIWVGNNFARGTVEDRRLKLRSFLLALVALPNAAQLELLREFLGQVIPPIGAEGLDRRPPAGSCRLFLGPGFRLGARWNRLVETVKTRKKREKTGEKWARYGLKRVKEGS